MNETRSCARVGGSELPREATLQQGLFVDSDGHSRRPERPADRLQDSLHRRDSDVGTLGGEHDSIPAGDPIRPAELTSFDVPYAQVPAENCPDDNQKDRFHGARLYQALRSNRAMTLPTAQMSSDVLISAVSASSYINQVANDPRRCCRVTHVDGIALLPTCTIIREGVLVRGDASSISLPVSCARTKKTVMTFSLLLSLRS